MDDSQNPLQFSQVFQLIPDAGSYYVYVLLESGFASPILTRLPRYNDIFRLNYA